MKNNNVFDNLEYDIENIDENTVVVDTGVDCERIKHNVMNKIKSQKPKRKIAKKIVISLIAAVIAIIALTSTAVATGSFNSVFGELFSGESNAGLYSGGNISVTSTNDDFNMQVLGIAGDDNHVYAAFELTKTDGSSFLDTEKEYELYFDDFECDVSVPLLQYLHLTESYSGNSCVINLSEESDDKKLIYYVLFERDGNTLKGQNMTVKFSDLVVEQYEHLGEFTDSGEDIEKNKAVENKYLSQLSENQSITPVYNDSENLYEYCIVTSDTINVEIDVSLDLNYKSSTKECIVENDVDFMGIGTVESATVSSFGFTLYGTSCDVNTIDDAISNFESEVLMKNGDVYCLNFENYSISDKDFTISLEFVTDTESNNAKPIILEPSEIEKIIIDDIVFTIE